MDKVDEKLLDEKISKCLQNGHFEDLKDLIELPDDVIIVNISERENGEIVIPLDILQKILIARDKKVLGLKQYDISTAKVKDLDFDHEMIMYNEEMREKDEITVVRGKNKDGKDTVLYYYSDDMMATRQQRIFNEHGDVESMYRHAMFDDGRLKYIDNALVSYQYDNQGKKKAALYQDELVGMTYYEYDKDGDVIISIESDVVRQKIKEDGFTYTISDGFSERNTKLMPKTAELTPDDMQRAVSRNIPEDKRLSVLSAMDQKRKEEILSILTAVEPIFQSLSTDIQKNEQDVRRRMDKVVTWFTGFTKRLQIDPKLATQDSAVMSAMKGAVSKSIGKTAEAQADITALARDEKEYEGEEYEDN